MGPGSTLATFRAWRTVAAGAGVVAFLAGCSPGESSVSAEPATADAGDCCARVAADENPAAKLAGVWEPMANPTDLDSEAEPSFTQAAQKSVERQKELRDAGDISFDFSAICIPPASHTMTTLGAQELLVDDKKITWIMELTGGIRSIWMDGRDHPPLEELRPTTNGHAIGRWDGDALVVDSVGFMDKSMVYANLPGNVSIYPSSRMRFVERLRLVEDGNAIISERTLHDPVSLKEPWKTTVRYERRDWELAETICMENNDLVYYFKSGNLPGAEGNPSVNDYVQ